MGRPANYITHPPFMEAACPTQLTLFESLPGEPEGLRYAADFVSPAVEQKLISEIRTLPLQPFQFGQFEGKRRVASFGFRYDYDLRQLQRAEPMPGLAGRDYRESRNVRRAVNPGSASSLHRIRRRRRHRLAPRQAAF